MKPLIDIIDTTNEPNIIEQILTNGGSNAPIKQTNTMASILLVIFTTATLTWAATSQRNNSKR